MVNHQLLFEKMTKMNISKSVIQGVQLMFNNLEIESPLGPVKIGNNVQIGANSVVLNGVTIGNNVVIGAMSLVKDDIPNILMGIYTK